jgi:hypothetical protein
MPNATLVPVSASSEMPPSAGERTAHYCEPLRTPWWWYAVAGSIATVLAAEFYIGGFALTLWIPFGVLVPLSLFAVWWLGHSRLEIRDGELLIRGAHLPLRYVSGIVALDAATLRRVVGREGDPAAFVSIRPWIGPGLQLWLDDPEDPAPYWVVSSRHPQRVVDLVRSPDSTAG